MKNSAARDMRIVDLYYEGRTRQQIAHEVGMSRTYVNTVLEDIENDGEDDTSWERCQCGVRLPCQGCPVPVSADGPTLPDAPSAEDSRVLSAALDRTLSRVSR